MRRAAVRPHQVDPSIPTSTCQRRSSAIATTLRCDRTNARREAARDQRVLNGIEAQTIVVQAGAGFWNEVKEWGASKGLLSPDDMGILEAACSLPSKIPSERQSLWTMEILQRLIEEGCPLGLTSFDEQGAGQQPRV